MLSVATGEWHRCGTRMAPDFSGAIPRQASPQTGLPVLELVFLHDARLLARVSGYIGQRGAAKVVLDRIPCPSELIAVVVKRRLAFVYQPQSLNTGVRNFFHGTPGIGGNLGCHCVALR